MTPLQELQITRLDWNNVSHKQAFIKLMRHYSNDPMGGGKPIDVETLNRAFLDMSQRPFAHSFLVFDGTEAIALGNCIEAYSTFKAAPLINIHDFVVVAGYRNRGVAQWLLGTIEQFAQALGACKITLEVLSENPAAQKAYRKFGFTDYSLHPDAGHALFWQKNLTYD